MLNTQQQVLQQLAAHLPPVQAHVSAQASQMQGQLQPLSRQAQASTTSLSLQVPVQAHLHSHGNGDQVPQVSSRLAPPVVQAVARLAQASTTSLAQQVVPQPAHWQVHSGQHSPHVAPKNIEARTESQRSGLLHPPPRKVPSIAQLVAKVLPSQAPSPRVSERSLTIDDHSVSIQEYADILSLNIWRYRVQDIPIGL